MATLGVFPLEGDLLIKMCWYIAVLSVLSILLYLLFVHVLFEGLMLDGWTIGRMDLYCYVIYPPVLTPLNMPVCKSKHTRLTKRSKLHLQFIHTVASLVY